MTDKLHDAIVKAALERAAKEVSKWMNCEVIEDDIRSLASNPAEMAAIIKAAGEDRG